VTGPPVEDDPPPRTAEDVRRRSLKVVAWIRTVTDPSIVRFTRDAWLKGEWSRTRTRLQDLKKASSPEDRAELGRAFNEFKDGVQAACQARLREMEEPHGDVSSAAPDFDPTVPGRRPPRGSLHPITRVTEELLRVFSALGFEVATGPEVEDAAHNFEGLNIPEGHPARDPSENFSLPGGLLLRSQTSPVQVRVLETRTPPLRILAPGRVYRPDTVDARHLYAFHQVEGLCVGEGISMADLKGTLAAFAQGFYGSGVGTRFRPSYFPFTEPSAEMDVSCPSCGGGEGVRGCPTCGGEGWMELLGCGMVHPAVLRRAGHDPERWTGFAFGMGIERAAMRRWGIRDIRSLVENDVRFLGQFA